MPFLIDLSAKANFAGRRDLAPFVLPAFFLLVIASMANLAAQEEKAVTSRWEKDIQALERKIERGESAAGSILFVGSSSIRLWDLKTAFPGVATSNHGFGGSEISDSIQFFDRIVAPVKPAAVILYAGDNDIGKGKPSGQVVADFQQFVKLARTSLKPNTPVLFISIKPSLKRWSLSETMRDANERISRICDQERDLTYVDIWTPMLNADGVPKPEIFRDDGLHLNDQGYAIWNRVVGQAINTVVSTN